MTTTGSFTGLNIWKFGIELVREVYAITKYFPYDERFALTLQIQKAVTSILANFAEGYGRHTAADKSHKYTIARGECAEVKAFLLIAIELEFISSKRAEHALILSDKVGQLLNGLLRSYK